MRSPALQSLIDSISKEHFGLSNTDAIHYNNCVICKKKAVNFKDPESLREYYISGYCQECQDKTFY